LPLWARQYGLMDGQREPIKALFARTLYGVSQSGFLSLPEEIGAGGRQSHELEVE